MDADKQVAAANVTIEHESKLKSLIRAFRVGSQLGFEPFADSQLLIALADC